MTHNNDLADAVALLTDTRSPKRRSGARRFRKLADPAACPNLLTALQREVLDPRTWETQYQMIMALGTCGCVGALDYLWDLASRRFDATMVYLALGDAIVRLGRAAENDPTPVNALLATGNDMLIDGGFRAVAMLRLRFDAQTVEMIFEYVRPREPADGLRFWVAAAAAGWESPGLEAFLEKCIEGPRDDIRQAAIAAKAKRYVRYHPL